MILFHLTWSRLLSAPPFFRRLLFFSIDALLLPFVVWLSAWLRSSEYFRFSFFSGESWLLAAVLFIGLPLYSLTGQYRGLTRYVGSSALYSLSSRNGFLVLLLAASGWLFRLPMPPWSSWILLWLLLTFFTGAVRFALRDVLLSLRSIQNKRQS